MTSPYASKAPSPQLTVDLFEGEWVSKFPAPLGYLQAGQAGLFEDPRVDWAREKLAEFGVHVKGSTVLELGPLEGGHTYRLSQYEAASVTAIEAHPRAFLRCLVAKELLGMQRVNFLYGDALAFLRESTNEYDIGFACGFLYHMVNPVEAIEQLSRRCRSVFLWTVHWDPERNGPNAEGLDIKGPPFAAEHAGFKHTLHRHDYGSGFDYNKFFGGPASHAHWMEKEDILAAFRHFGMGRITVEFESNPNGRALRLVAARDA
ncbi:MAG TPA: class I SAM-dependent methyltransferase [Opitutaceae bacterium]|nr:class I SAM-dependent methyltransferase [Opitutaceae bacterium]